MDKQIEEETIILLLKELGETDLSDIKRTGWAKLCRRLMEQVCGDG